MSSGLRYETGRDMPPGMAEKVAVQIARRMVAAVPPVTPEALQVADCDVANKMRLIDANKYPCYKCEAYGCGTVCDMLKDWLTTTVDAVEVVHGRWIKDGDMVVCSNCGEEHAWDEYRATYCEDCGAKMDGGNGNA